jgi:ABC-type transport system involved in cytochrome bd biosynthesis fused ATPase/permease subunit
MLEEREEANTKGFHEIRSDATAPRPGSVIRVKNIVGRWTDEAPDVLLNVSLEAGPGNLVAVIGPVGSGKVRNFSSYILRTCSYQHQIGYESSSQRFHGSSFKVFLHIEIEIRYRASFKLNSA